MGNTIGETGRRVAEGAQVAGKMGSAAPVPASVAEDSRTSGRAPRNRGGDGGCWRERFTWAGCHCGAKLAPFPDERPGPAAFRTWPLSWRSAASGPRNGRRCAGGVSGPRQPVARPAPWKGDCIGPRDARRRAAAHACRALGGHFSSVSIHISTGPVVHARMQHTVPPTLTRSSATRRRWVGEPLAPAFSRRVLGSGPGVVVPYRSFRLAKAMVGGYPSIRPARMRPSQPEMRPCSIGC